MFKMFKNYTEAKKEAEETNQPLWDTNALPERYGVGEPTIEMEEDADNEDLVVLKDYPTTQPKDATATANG